MKTILLAITAALAVVAAMKLGMNNQAPARLLGSSSDPIQSSWTLWKMKHGRSYGVGNEEAYRFKVFTDNYNKIAAFNKTKATHTVELNKFADLTNAEFKAQYTGLKKQKVFGAKKSATYFSKVGVPESYDARNDNLVNPVKDQGQCGSCWAFSTVGAIEGQRAKAGLGLDSFSEQMLVDCAPSPNQGCNGGDMGIALNWVVSNPLASESDYRYTARDGTCKASEYDHPGKISSYGSVAADADQVRSAIYDRGAVSVAIEADQMSFQFYSGGVITSGCGSNLDHGVTGIGYGNEDGSDYFLIRNSWGADWGVGGYVKIAPTQCGVMQEVNYAVA